jgi:hypothetical protein
MDTNKPRIDSNGHEYWIQFASFNALFGAIFAREEFSRLFEILFFSRILRTTTSTESFVATLPHYKNYRLGQSRKLRQIILQHLPFLRAKLLTQFFLCATPERKSSIQARVAGWGDEDVASASIRINHLN